MDPEKPTYISECGTSRFHLHQAFSSGIQPVSDVERCAPHVDLRMYQAGQFEEDLVRGELHSRRIVARLCCFSPQELRGNGLCR